MIQQIRSQLLVNRDFAGSGGSRIIRPTSTMISTEATAFIARTSGLDATRTDLLTTYIDGLVYDGVWSKLDFLHIYAAPDTTNAKLSLVSATYDATFGVSTTFTADRGITGSNNSSSAFSDTHFDPSIASSPKYVQDSAHNSAWSVTNVTDSFPLMGAQTSGGATTQIYPRFSDGNSYYRINDAGSLAGVANANGSGHYIVNRSSSSAVQGYKNGSSVLSSSSDTSNGVPGVTLTSVAVHTNSGQLVFGSAYQCAMDSGGSSLSSTDASNLYSRTRTLLTAIGVP